MPGVNRAPGSPASLRRLVGWQLLGVGLVFVLGVACSLWLGLRAINQEQQNLLRIEAEHTKTAVVRLHVYYRTLLEKASRDPALIDLMNVGTRAEQEDWAARRQRILPDLLGFALLDPKGSVLGDARSLRVGPRCERDLQEAEALGALQPLLHREIAGAEHFDLVQVVRDAGGESLGAIFLSVRLSQLEHLLDDTRFPEHAMTILDAAGNVLAGRGKIAGNFHEVRLPIADAGWTLVVHAPVKRLAQSGKLQVLAGVVTLSVILLLLAVSMLRVRHVALDGITSIRDALAALARDDDEAAMPEINPSCVELKAVTHDINRIAQQLRDQRAKLTELSLMDTLTGLPNRRAFETQFTHMLGLADRGHAIALVLLDVDHFKAINDQHGHATGDKALIALANTLRALTRSADMTSRLAGDEFTVLLAGLDKQGVEAWYQRLADRFRSELRASGLELDSAISAGQTWLQSMAGDSLGKALARADYALYQAKERGRGQLMLEGEWEERGAG